MRSVVHSIIQSGNCWLCLLSKISRTFPVYKVPVIKFAWKVWYIVAEYQCIINYAKLIIIVLCSVCLPVATLLVDSLGERK